MRPVATQVMHHVGHVDEEMEMGIAQEAMAHIMTVLTDLYSDPQLAIIREYSTNALDSNIEAGNKAPIEVTLPTSTNPHLVIKDQGIGLNVDGIRNIYSQYGSSTKRQSDLVTGMLGLGCKSGLTYATQFTVDAIKNGVRTIAIVTKNTDGVGTIKILDTAGTSEPNGVTITVPVKLPDVGSFQMKANNFYRFWEPGTVVVDGEPPAFEREVDDEQHLWIDPDVRVSQQRGQSYVVMGNVPYPFTFPNHDLQYSIVAWVPMGSVTFTPSREALSYVIDGTTGESPTQVTLDALRELIFDRFEYTLTKKLESAPNNWERMKVWSKWRWQSPRNPRGHGINGFSVMGNMKVPEKRTAFRFDTYADKAHKYGEFLSHSDVQDEREGIVTGFPHRSVIPSARERLKQFLVEKANGYHRIWVLPEMMVTDVLEGRPKVWTWDHVLDNTDAPAKEKRSKGQVTYTFYEAGNLGFNEGAFDEEDTTPLLFVPVAELPVSINPNSRNYYYYNNGQPKPARTIPEVSQRYPEARFVALGENQIAKFQRLHPQAERYTTYIDRVKREALNALTELDKQSAHLSGIPSKLANDLRQATVRLSDPDLRKIMKLGGHTSDAIKRCSSLGLTIPAPKSPLGDELLDRYPLLRSLYNNYSSSIGPKGLDDLVLYLEAKFGITADD